MHRLFSLAIVAVVALASSSVMAQCSTCNMSSAPVMNSGVVYGSPVYSQPMYGTQVAYTSQSSCCGNVAPVSYAAPSTSCCGTSAPVNSCGNQVMYNSGCNSCSMVAARPIFNRRYNNCCSTAQPVYSSGCNSCSMNTMGTIGYSQPMTYVGGGTIVGTSGCAGCNMSSAPVMSTTPGTPVNGSVITPTPANNDVKPAEAKENVTPPSPIETKKDGAAT